MFFWGFFSLSLFAALYVDAVGLSVNEIKNRIKVKTENNEMNYNEQ